MQICSPKAFQNKTCLTAPVFSSLFNNPQDIMDAWIMSIFWFHWWLKWVKTVCRCCFFAPNVNIFRGHFLLIPIIFWKIVDLYYLEKDYFCITKNSFQSEENIFFIVLLRQVTWKFDWHLPTCQKATCQKLTLFSAEEKKSWEKENVSGVA